ncbi:hypothetical protein ACHAXR_004262 [Thalassiosira sp. AJA248-18]
MCCWPKDRQANDNNGNCATPYDSQCVDKDVADNTNLCFADLAKGNLSSGFDSDDGFMVFPEDNNNGEGAIHCHGFAWADDEQDSISRYKANNLFFVSMYDHMHQRGYVKNIPGMPMCGCMEQMPLATRSDCTQVDLTEDWRMDFDGASNTFSGTLEKVEVDFNACRGRNGRNNDLWAYAARLYDEERMTRHQFSAVGRVLTNDHDCYQGTENAKHSKGYVTGYVHDVEKWTKVAGRDNMYDGEPFGREAFNTALFEQNLDGASVIMRICPDCTDTHRRIFYRRKSGPPDASFDILHNILYQRSDGGGNNRWDLDFSLHSTYAEAVLGENPWLCDNGFNYGAPFDGECSPTGARTRNQYSRFDSYPGPRPNVAYYVNTPEYTGVQDYLDNNALTRATGLTDIDIGPVGKEGNTLENNGVYHITGSGHDIWGHADTFHYKSQPWEGDIDVSVHISSFANTAGQTYAKAGIMLRSDNSPDATYAFMQLTGTQGLYSQFRRSKGNHAGTLGSQVTTNPYPTSAYLRIVKKMETIEYYYGDGTPTGWVLHATDTMFFPNDEYRVGLAVCSHYNGVLAEATFENYAIQEYSFPTAAPSVSSAPTPWSPLVDINVQRAGEFYEDASGNTWIKGSGTDIWGNSDSFMFYNTQVDNDDLSVEMLITKFHPNEVHARGGIMIRDTNDANASNVFVGAAGAHAGVTFQSRSVGGESTTHHKMIYTNWDNRAWVKLTKVDDLVTAYYKMDQEGAVYIELGSVQLTTTGSKMQVGRAVTAGTDYHNALATMEGRSYNIV